MTKNQKDMHGIYSPVDIQPSTVYPGYIDRPKEVKQEDVWVLGFGNIKCSSVGIDVAPIKEVYNGGCGFKVIILAPRKQFFSCLTLEDWTITSSCTIHVWVLPCSYLYLMDWTFKHVSQTQLNIVLMKSALVIMPVHSTKILTKTLGQLGGGKIMCG